VTDIFVIYFSPKGIFENESIQALSKWKYEPLKDVEFVDKNRNTYRKFTSVGSREKTLLPSDYRVSDKGRFKFVIPELEIVYFERYDFTHDLYFSDENILKTIAKYAQESGVYLI